MDLDRSGGEVDYLGEIASRLRFVLRRTVRLRRSSPITSLGHRCDVVAPSLIPTKPGEPPLHRNDSDGLTENPVAVGGKGCISIDAVEVGRVKETNKGDYGVWRYFFEA